jgi:hypothetical protein
MSRSYAEMVTDTLRDESTPPPRFPSDRQRLVEAVERGLRARQRRQQIARWSLAASAAAAVLVLVIGGKTLLSPYAPPAGSVANGPTRSRVFVLSSPDQAGQGAFIPGNGAQQMPIEPGMVLPQGFRLVAPPAGEVHIGAPRGTTLALEGGGEVAISEANVVQRYELKSGAIRARVAKLMAGERFIIATSDAEVEVHGTAFRVAVVPADPSCGSGTITRVSVTEGVVSVRRGGVDVRVTPGHVWPESCADAASTSTAAAPAASSAGTAASVSAPGRARARGGLVRAALRAPAVTTTVDVVTQVAPEAPAEVAKAPAIPFTRSELAAQNDMFAAAVHAKRRGQGTQAVRIFERLTREYPSSPLAESAVVQRMKLLSVIDSVAARQAAGEYLAHYPTGFARVDAHHIIDRP